MDVRKLHKQLLQSFQSSSPDLDSIRKQLSKLKIALTESNLLVPSSQASADGTPAASTAGKSAKDWGVARDVLEIGAFVSVRAKDVSAFDRYLSLLSAFYDDEGGELGESSNYQPLMGLKLLRLLSSNQIAAFHVALETLPADMVRDSVFLQHPVSLERWLMEGSYSKVWRTSQQKPPREEYQFFVDMLMHMIRTEIASCEEKAYDSLPLADAATLLFFDNLQDVLKFAGERGWSINPTSQTVDFAATNSALLNHNSIPKKATITSNLLFAKELESIV